MSYSYLNTNREWPVRVAEARSGADAAVCTGERTRDCKSCEWSPLVWRAGRGERPSRCAVITLGDTSVRPDESNWGSKHRSPGWQLAGLSKQEPTSSWSISGKDSLFCMLRIYFLMHVLLFSNCTQESLHLVMIQSDDDDSEWRNENPIVTIGGDHPRQCLPPDFQQMTDATGMVVSSTEHHKIVNYKPWLVSLESQMHPLNVRSFSRYFCVFILFYLHTNEQGWEFIINAWPRYHWSNTKTSTTGLWRKWSQQDCEQHV